MHEHDLTPDKILPADIPDLIVGQVIDEKLDLDQVMDFMREVGGKMIVAAVMNKEPDDKHVITISEDGTSDSWVKQMTFGAVQAAGHQKASLEMRDRMTELEELAVTDPLTKLLNKGGWEQAITEFVNDTTIGESDKRKIKTQAAVLMIDLDDFKQKINDVIGQDGGDNVLVEVAHRLRSVLRKGDKSARIGGDEFAVLVKVSDVDASLLEGLLENVRIKIRDALAGEYTTDEDVTVGFSATVDASMIKPGEHPNAAMRRADLGVKEKKRQKKVGR